MHTRRKPRTPARSTDPGDYQNVRRPFAAMAKSFPDGFEIAPHHHKRDQLIYAVSGVMRVRTAQEAWIVPPDRAVYVPGHTTHSLSMRGAVAMRTLYIAPGAVALLPGGPTVIGVSDLLRELILALIAEPLLYEVAGRGGAIVSLLVSEIARAPRLPLVIPMPQDTRLHRVCDALLATPADPRTLDGWSHVAGASARTLARLFESELKLSFSGWRQRVRFHNALEAIARGEPIGSIAAQNGYRSPSAFSAAFRGVMGYAPSGRHTPSLPAGRGGMERATRPVH